MKTELVPEMSENIHILKQLFTQENLIEDRHSSKMLKEAISFAAFIHSRLVLHKSAKESTQISPTCLSINCLMSVSSPTPIRSHNLLHSVCVCVCVCVVCACVRERERETFKIPCSERGWDGKLKCVEILNEENNKPLPLQSVIQQVSEAHWYTRMTVLKLINEPTEVTQNYDKCSFIYIKLIIVFNVSVYAFLKSFTNYYNKK